MIQVDTDAAGGFEDLVVDLTPMLDILFIVLIFFILTANPSLHALKVDLPSKGIEQASLVTVLDHVQLTLFKKKQWAVNNHVFTDWEDAKHSFNQLIQNQPDLEIIIATEKSASVERFLQVMAFLKQHDLQAAQIRMDTNLQ